MRTVNLGIVAHVDAGKTSLTERLLLAAGVIDELGSVDDGNTRTDTLALERRRGITIKSAVVSFAVGDTIVNLIDTPGHPDFIAEVERVLGVLDGAVLVVSAVEGVQAQTRVLMRTLRRLGIPTLIFVNKIDRSGARWTGVLDELAARLTPALVPLNAPRALGGRSARVEPVTADVAVLAEHDDELLAAYVRDRPVPPGVARARLAAQTARTLVHPVFFGSAITGAGLDDLVGGITGLLPAAGGDPAAEVDASVFKVDRAGAYVRVFDGTLRVRDRVGERRVTGLDDVADGPAAAVGPGHIALVRGLPGIRIGDTIGVGRHRPAPQFAPPSLEAVVVPDRAADKGALLAALTELAAQDPLIDLRQDDLRGEIYVSLYGEVQKEVVQATLADEYGLAVGFRDTTTLCVERLTGAGEADEAIKQDGNPFLATVGLRVEPAPPGAGVEFRLGVELGSMPLAFFKATEDTVRRTLREGLRGWPVPDCVVTMTRSGYAPRQSAMHAPFDKSMSSTGADFRGLVPLVVVDALRRAGTVVCEPIHAFRLEVPADSLATVLPAVARRRGVPLSSVPQGTGYVVQGEIPAAAVHELQQVLPGLTRGEGVLESAFERHAPVAGPAPQRARTDQDPRDRKGYLLRVGAR